MEEVKLLDHQIKHCANLSKSLQKYSRALDASDTGTGKTFVSIQICKNLKLIPWIVCPKSVVSAWVKVLKLFGYLLSSIKKA